MWQLSSNFSLIPILQYFFHEHNHIHQILGGSYDSQFRLTRVVRTAIFHNIQAYFLAGKNEMHT